MNGRNIQADIAKSEPRKEQPGAITILLVDDDPDCRMLVSDAINQSKVSNRVFEVSNGQEALDFLTQPRPVSLAEELIAIFLDLKLPGLGGLELLRRLRNRAGLDDIPVIVMTSSNNPDDLEECRRLKVTNYVSKPVTFTSFSKAVADVFHLPRFQPTPPSPEN